MNTAIDKMVKRYWQVISIKCKEELKEVEKKQIEEAYKQGYSDCNNNLDCTPERFYNETYKQP